MKQLLKVAIRKETLEYERFSLGRNTRVRSKVF